MNPIDFVKMNKNRALYECMWGSAAFNFPVQKTADSNNSYTFANTSAVDEGICQNELANVFNIKRRNMFKQKFTQSISGDGKELQRIATVHSSSLCALLFFYNVSEDNPYVMEIEGEEYIFTYSCFEYQNTVIKGRRQSNIDVVLIGKNKSTEKQTVLFLESKFSEYYLDTGKKSHNGIAVAYLNNKYGASLYGKDSLEKMELSIEKNKDGKSFFLCSEKDCYLDGIKQMISHYIGVRNLCDDPSVKNDEVAKAVAAGAKVILGEILFTKGIGALSIGSGEKCLLSYQKKYRALAEILNEQLRTDGMGDKITVLGDVLSYSQFRDKDFIKEPLIKMFYFEFGK